MPKSRIVSTTLNDILSLVHSAEDYGFADDVFYDAMAGITGNVTDAEIEAYGESLGWDEEDAEEVVERLTEWRDKYAKDRS